MSERVQSSPRICLIKSRRYPLLREQVVDGGTLHVFNLVEELAARGIGVDVFTRREEGEPPVVRRGRVTVFSVPFDRSSSADTIERDYQEGESFVAAVLKNKDFTPRRYVGIQTHHWTSAVGLPAALPAECKVFHTPHLLAREKAVHNGRTVPLRVEAAEKGILDRADALFALSVHEASVITGYYGIAASKIHVTPNGISSGFFELPAPIFQHAVCGPLLFIGRLCKQKGLDVLVRAAVELVERGCSPSTLVVGGSYGEPLYEETVSREMDVRQVRRCFHMAGQVPHREILRFMRNAAIYVQPSRYESQGIALLEAMASGRAVIASDLPAIREYLTHGLNGLLVKPEDASGIADAVLQLAGDPAASAEMALEARRHARQFTWAATWHRTIPVLTGSDPS